MFWRGVLGYLPANIVQGVTGFVALYAFTRVLTPESYGLYAVAAAIVSLIHTGVFTWIEASMARFQVAAQGEGAERDHAATLYRLMLCMTGVLAVVALAVGLALRAQPEFALAVIVGLVAAVARVLMRLSQERSRAEGEVAAFVAQEMTYALAGLGAGLALAALGLKGAAPIAGTGVAALLCVLWTWRGERRRRAGGRVDWARARGYAAYGVPVSMALIVSIALFSVDRMMIAGLLGPAEAGAYHAGYSVANRTIDVIFIWLGAASGPALVAALETGGREALNKAALPQAELMAVLGLPAAAGLALVAEPLAQVLVGPELRAAAAQVTPGIALSSLMAGFSTYYVLTAFTLAKRTGVLLVCMAAPLTANVLLNIVLIPRFGLEGAVAATVLSFAFGLVLGAVISRRVGALPLPWQAVGRSLVACAAMALAVRALPALGGLPELILKCGTGALVYGAAALALDAGGCRRLGGQALGKLRARYSRNERAKIATSGSVR